MNTQSSNKKKIFNDPIYGFISIPYEIVFDIIEHPYFQRLRRIKQLGLTHLVYPGAHHTRFHHAMGAMYLMGLAIEAIRSKGTEITEEEAKAVTIAILLHDIGHGPFSHALEKTLVDVKHEDISSLLMDSINTDFKGQLTLAIQIFNNQYQKKFLHQLVSGQLDMDRLDYLNRDSFFTGVSEGVVSYDRIIKMLTVYNDELVIEEKGIYSIEKFIIARRLMYWQVYFHKTVIAAEQLLLSVLKRAKELAEQGTQLFCTPALQHFLYERFDENSLKKDKTLLDLFAQLDDYDIFTSIKVWTKHEDLILASLCLNLINRNLYKTEIQNEPFKATRVKEIEEKAMQQYGVDKKEVKYYVFTDTISNNAYNLNASSINILFKNGTVQDISKASDHLNISALSQEVVKYFICYPKFDKK